MSLHTRRGFVVTGVSSLLAAGLKPARSELAAQESPPPLSPEQVFEFVSVAHTDLERTTQMLAEEPRLLNATWDWGGGDFETALGGASHMGNRDIGGLLLAHGARIDLFCAAMMGMFEVVRAVVDVYPAAVHWKGPHAIPLLVHAELGQAEEVAAFLRMRGAT